MEDWTHRYKEKLLHELYEADASEYEVNIESYLHGLKPLTDFVKEIDQSEASIQLAKKSLLKETAGNKPEKEKDEVNNNVDVSSLDDFAQKPPPASALLQSPPTEEPEAVTTVPKNKKGKANGIKSKINKLASISKSITSISKLGKNKSNKVKKVQSVLEMKTKENTTPKIKKEKIKESIPEDKNPVTEIKKVTTEAPTTKEDAAKSENMLPETKDESVIEEIVQGPRIYPPSPLPKNATYQDFKNYITRINSYINKLGYHHVGEPAIRVITHLSLRHLMETSRQIIKANENIKCLHALLLGIYFTNSAPLIERFPINFKSKFNGKEYRHVVLGIYLFGAYGALGISRDAGLQEKSPHYLRLTDLLCDYIHCYNQSGHIVNEIKIGGVVPKDSISQCKIPWRVGQAIHLGKLKGYRHFSGDVERLAKLVRAQMSQACIRNIRPVDSKVAKLDCSFRLAIEQYENIPTDERNLAVFTNNHKLIMESKPNPPLVAAAVAAAIRPFTANLPIKKSSGSLSLKHRHPKLNPTPKSGKVKKRVLKHKKMVEP